MGLPKMLRKACAQVLRAPDIEDLPVAFVEPRQSVASALVC
jgi:hypothetical protein